MSINNPHVNDHNVVQKQTQIVKKNKKTKPLTEKSDKPYGQTEKA